MHDLYHDGNLSAPASGTSDAATAATAADNTDIEDGFYHLVAKWDGVRLSDIDDADTVMGSGPGSDGDSGGGDGESKYKLKVAFKDLPVFRGYMPER
jgi:hypothetical protein